MERESEYRLNCFREMVFAHQTEEDIPIWFRRFVDVAG